MEQERSGSPARLLRCLLLNQDRYEEPGAYEVGDDPIPEGAYDPAPYALLRSPYLGNLRALRFGEPVDDDERYSKTCYALLCDLKKRMPAIKKSIVNISFADDEWYYPLQAADLLAYASRNELKKGEKGWSETNIYRDLLKDADPAYGKRYLGEFWSDDEDDSRRGSRQDHRARRGTGYG